MIRQREIVIVRVLDAPRTTGLARPLERIQAKLAAGGTRLAIGVSTALEGVGRLSDGYREAYVAVQSIRPEGGVVCLEDLNPFEYLALRSDATAQRLVSPAIVMDAILRESRHRPAGSRRLTPPVACSSTPTSPRRMPATRICRRSSCCSRTTTGSAGTCSKTSSPAGNRTAGAGWPRRTRLA